MALTLAQRARAAREQSDFTDGLSAMIVKHARWRIGNGGEQPESLALAANILDDADAYVRRFALAFMTMPGAGQWIDELEDVTAITDQQIEDMVPELWPLFVR